MPLLNTISAGSSSSLGFATTKPALNYSVYFDGSTSYLTTTAPNLSGSWTVELWWYSTVGSVQQTFISFNAGSNTGINMWVNTSNQLVVDNGVNGQSAFTTVTLGTFQWNHIAIVRDGTTTKGYINGVLAGSNSFTPNTTSAMWIGRYNSGTPYYSYGYISNVRVVNGVAVYTAAFTPPYNTSLSEIAGTSIITCATKGIRDISSNRRAITVNGANTVSTTRSPYNDSWSVSFDNANYMNMGSTSGQYLTVNNVAGTMDIGTGDFTLEGWIYPRILPAGDTWPTNYQNTSSLFGRGTPNTADGYNLILGATKLIFQNSDTIVTSGTHNIKINTWYHVAASRTGSNLLLFVNGVQVASNASATFTGGAGSKFYVGCETGQGAYFNGFMSNVRLVKGIGLYTGTFTPPAYKLTPIANTSLLLCQSSTLRDNSSNGYTVTNNNTTTIREFNPVKRYSSVYFDGNGDNLTITSNSAMDIGGGDFTIEFWYYYTTQKGYQGIFSKPNGATDGNAIVIYFESNNTGPRVLAGNGSWVINMAPGSTPSPNTWNHCALTKSGTTWRLYGNGYLQASQTATFTLNFSNTYPIYIGKYPYLPSYNSTKDFAGYMSNFRIVKGTALYTANSFAVPALPLQVVPNTLLLTCNSNNFKDSSPYNWTINANGDTLIDTFTPDTNLDDTPPRGVPTSISNSNVSYTSQTINWVNADTTAQTRVYRDAGAGLVLIATVAPGVTSYNDTACSAYTSYTYYAVHVASGLEGTKSTGGTGTTAPLAWANGGDEIDVSGDHRWHHMSDGEGFQFTDHGNNVATNVWMTACGHHGGHGDGGSGGYGGHEGAINNHDTTSNAFGGGLYSGRVGSGNNEWSTFNGWYAWGHGDGGQGGGANACGGWGGGGQQGLGTNGGGSGGGGDNGGESGGGGAAHGGHGGYGGSGGSPYGWTSSGSNGGDGGWGGGGGGGGGDCGSGGGAHGHHGRGVYRVGYRIR